MTPTPTPHGIQNASNGFVSGFGDATGILVPVIVVMSVIITLLGSQHAYRWALRSASTFAASLEYAIKGVATAIVGAVFIAPLYALSQTTPGQREVVGKALAVIVAGYIALVALGFVGDRVWSLVAKRHEKATCHRPFENWQLEADTDE